MATDDVVEIYSDGACRGNPGPGGWGALLRAKGAEKEISGVDVRTAMREGRPWQSLVPAGVARVIESLGRTPQLTPS